MDLGARRLRNEASCEFGRRAVAVPPYPDRSAGRLAARGCRTRRILRRCRHRIGNRSVVRQSAEAQESRWNGSAPNVAPTLASHAPCLLRSTLAGGIATAAPGRRLEEEIEAAARQTDPWPTLPRIPRGRNPRMGRLPPVLFRCLIGPFDLRL